MPAAAPPGATTIDLESTPFFTFSTRLPRELIEPEGSSDDRFFLWLSPRLPPLA